MKHVRPNRHALRYELLDYRRFVSARLKERVARPVCAIDTETYRGRAKLISDSLGNTLYDGDIDALLHFLSHARYRNTIIFCYNLQFDAEAILKMLPEENIRELIDQNVTQYYTFRLKYIPKKMFTLKDKNRHTTRLFDIAQFYEMNLDNALEKYLGLRKTEYPYTALLNTSRKIWETDLPNIITYNQDDARKTALLGEYLQQNIQSLFGFNPRSYISKASLAKDLVRIRGYVPDVHKIPQNARKAAFYAYKGGRFEVCQRGHFPETRLYDINSAYPSVIRNLIDVTYGEWKPVTDWSEDAYYGFYLCQVYAKPRFLAPCAYLLPNGAITFPTGTMLTYLTKGEILTYSKHALINVIRGWEFYPSRIRYPFRKYIDMLHAQKQTFEKSDYKYDMVKKMMNSLYGCFYEKISSGLRWKVGALFNPIYASIITADTRRYLYETAIQHEKQVIALQTDSILFNGPVSLKTSNKLGGWQLESSGDAIVLQSGIYLIAGKLRSRGMSKGKKIQYQDVLYPDPFQMIRQNPVPTRYAVSQERPLHIRECLTRPGTLSKEDVNIWHNVRKSINVNADVKREWLSGFEYGGDIFYKSQSSKPWHFTPGNL